MQAFAAWTNLSETAFLLRPFHPQADYRIRIFTPSRELPFAGHPTLGAAAAWLQAGGHPKTAGRLTQEGGGGLVCVRIDEDLLFFRSPPLTKVDPLSEGELVEVAATLGIDRPRILDARWLVNGPEWIGVRLASAAEVMDVGLPSRMPVGLRIGIVGPHGRGSVPQLEVRAFVGGSVVREDPVTGSLNAGLGWWLNSTGHAGSSYIASQGTAVLRQGRVSVRVEEGHVWVGGHVTKCVEGEVLL